MPDRPDAFAARADRLVATAFREMADYVANTPEEVIQADFARFTDAVSVSAEEAGAGFRAFGRQLRERGAPTPEEWRQAADRVQALARQIAEVADRG